jgi:uncharacterized membrane protein (DUF2068 family)
VIASPRYEPTLNPMASPLPTKRPLGLLAIVAYKSVVALALTAITIGLITASATYDELHALAAAGYPVDGSFQPVNMALEYFLNLSPRTLQLSGLGSGAYAIVTGIEAIGLWYEKRWAHFLVLGLVGLGLPPEIYEMTKGLSPLNVIVFAINGAAFAYLLRHIPPADSHDKFHDKPQDQPHAQPLPSPGQTAEIPPG